MAEYIRAGNAVRLAFSGERGAPSAIGVSADAPEDVLPDTRCRLPAAEVAPDRRKKRRGQQRREQRDRDRSRDDPEAIRGQPDEQRQQDRESRGRQVD